MPRHIRWPEEDTAIAVTTSFLSDRGAYMSWELVWSPLMGQTWMTPAAEPSIMEVVEALSSSDCVLVGMERMKLGAETDMDIGLICLCIWISNIFMSGSGTYCREGKDRAIRVKNIRGEIEDRE